VQRELTAQLAASSGLEVLSFRHFDCLVFARGEILKMFRPASKRVLMGRSTDRRVNGELILVFEDELKRLRPPSERFEFPEPIFSTPIANFKGLILHSLLQDGTVDKIFIERVGKLLDTLPSGRAGWRATFGREFPAQPCGDRTRVVNRFLRERVVFHDAARNESLLNISIVEPPPARTH
jgi:hypothetical protein